MLDGEMNDTMSHVSYYFMFYTQQTHYKESFVDHITRVVLSW